jgi:hypothetical protein
MSHKSVDIVVHKFLTSTVIAFSIHVMAGGSASTHQNAIAFVHFCIFVHKVSGLSIAIIRGHDLISIFATADGKSVLHETNGFIATLDHRATLGRSPRVGITHVGRVDFQSIAHAMKVIVFTDAPGTGSTRITVTRIFIGDCRYTFGYAIHVDTYFIVHDAIINDMARVNVDEFGARKARSRTRMILAIALAIRTGGIHATGSNLVTQVHSPGTLFVRINHLTDFKLIVPTFAIGVHASVRNTIRRNRTLQGIASLK